MQDSVQCLLRLWLQLWHRHFCHTPSAVASHRAKTHINVGWGKCTPPILVGRVAKSHGKERGCVILTEERGEGLRGGTDYQAHSAGLCLGLGAECRVPGVRSPESGLEGGREGLWVKCMGKRCRNGVSLVRSSCSPAGGRAEWWRKVRLKRGPVPDRVRLTWVFA